MRINWIAATFAAAGIVLSSSAFGWSENGHQTVGAIADSLIHGTPAEAQVQSILGTINGQQLTLSQASVWADCARSIKPYGDFLYVPGQYHIQACAIFEDDDGKAAMSDYAKRNNSNCPYEGQQVSCHKAFHFADIAIERDSYSGQYTGSQPYDVVHAINAAIAVLQGQPCPAPFNIASKKEALMLLTHFVGDLHQPLHVGAVYLAKDGSIVDPDGDNSNAAMPTGGGNFIKGTGGVLHTQWDKTTFNFTDDQSVQSLVAEAQQVPTSTGDISQWAVAWASDTIVAAHSSFTGISFGKEVPPNTGTNKTKNPLSPAKFDDRHTYETDMKSLQEQQVVKGGARLAQLLQKIWPN